MKPGGSVTGWFLECQRGDSAAASAIWHRYYPQLVRMARDRLRGVPRGMADEEDVALSAMSTFFDGARQGRFPDLADRYDLWRLLVRITACKAIDLARHEKRKCRCPRRQPGEAAVEPSEEMLAQVIGDSPTPEFAATMAEQCRLLLDRLDDKPRRGPPLRELAMRKMEGYTNAELAEQFDCSERTIERGLQLIRRKWKEEPDQ